MNNTLDPSKFQWIGEKSIRFDLPPAPDEPPEVARKGLIDLFRAWVAQRPEDRRAMPRHKTLPSEVWLGWRRGNDTLFANMARMVNISRGGAQLRVADPPPEQTTVWICLGEPDQGDCLEATVLEVRGARRNECTVRIAFREPCPHRFFEAAVCILAPSEPRNRKALGTGSDEG